MSALAAALGDLQPSPAPRHMLRLDQPSPVWVYAHIDADGAVLYIGCSGQPTQRLKEHRRKSAWYARIAEIRYLGPFREWDGARMEERLIREHQPEFNRQHRTSGAVQPSQLVAATPNP